MNRARIRHQRQASRAAARSVRQNFCYPKSNFFLYKLLPWLTEILLAIALLTSGGSLVMSLRAQSRANALQAQVAAYEAQRSAEIQNETAIASEQSPTPESEGQTANGQDTTNAQGTVKPNAAEQSKAQTAETAQKQTESSVQTVPKTNAQQAVPPKSGAAVQQQQAAPAAQSAAQTQPPVQKQEITVYVTKTGDCYHSGECSHLRQSKVPTTLEAAKAQGYRRCSKCDAPR